MCNRSTVECKGGKGQGSFSSYCEEATVEVLYFMFSPSVSTSLFSRSWNSARRALLKKSKKKNHFPVMSFFIQTRRTLTLTLTLILTLVIGSYYFCPNWNACESRLVPAVTEMR